MCRAQGTEVPGHRFKSLGNTIPTPPEWHACAHHESPAWASRPLPPAFTGAPCVSVILKPCLPLKDLCHLVLVEDEAGMIVPQDSHDAQA